MAHWYRQLLTITTSTDASSGGGDTTTTLTTSELKKRSRQSSKNASIGRLDAKRAKLDIDHRYKAAFKVATNNLVAASATATKATREPVHSICDRLNQEFKLDGQKRLARSTVYKAAKDGLAGTSPKRRVLHQGFQTFSWEWWQRTPKSVKLAMVS